MVGCPSSLPIRLRSKLHTLLLGKARCYAASMALFEDWRAATSQEIEHNIQLLAFHDEMAKIAVSVNQLQGLARRGAEFLQEGRKVPKAMRKRLGEYAGSGQMMKEIVE